jgi:hypothetical protein
VTRRSATITQSHVARSIRAARKSGAEYIEVRPDGTIIILLKAPTTAPVEVDAFAAWEKEYESEKAAGRR